jgi:hypothetical protein
MVGILKPVFGQALFFRGYIVQESVFKRDKAGPGSEVASPPGTGRLKLRAGRMADIRHAIANQRAYISWTFIRKSKTATFSGQLNNLSM